MIIVSYNDVTKSLTVNTLYTLILFFLWMDAFVVSLGNAHGIIMIILLLISFA